MILADGFLGLVLIAVWLFCIIDVITTDESDMRNLPKAIWLLLVLLLFDLGAIIWLVAGRNWSKSPANRMGGRSSGLPGADRGGRRVPTNPDDDEDFLRQIKARADEQRRNYEAERKHRQAEQDGSGKGPDEE